MLALSLVELFDALPLICAVPLSLAVVLALLYGSLFLFTVMFAQYRGAHFVLGVVSDQLQGVFFLRERVPLRFVLLSQRSGR